jgi:hypothetical protein
METYDCGETTTSAWGQATGRIKTERDRITDLTSVNNYKDPVYEPRNVQTPTPTD